MRNVTINEVAIAAIAIVSVVALIHWW